MSKSPTKSPSATPSEEPKELVKECYGDYKHKKKLASVGTNTAVTTAATLGAAAMRGKHRQKQNRANTTAAAAAAAAGNAIFVRQTSKGRQAFPVEKFGRPQQGTGNRARVSRERQSFPFEKFRGEEQTTVSQQAQPLELAPERTDVPGVVIRQHSNESDIENMQEPHNQDDDDAADAPFDLESRFFEQGIQGEQSLIEAVLVTDESDKGSVTNAPHSSDKIQLADVVQEKKPGFFRTTRGALICVGVAILASAGAVVGAVVMTASEGESNPVFFPTPQPTPQPSLEQTYLTSLKATSLPTPTHQPSYQSTSKRTVHPSHMPTFCPSSMPSFCPSSMPSVLPSLSPSVQPSLIPSVQPSYSLKPSQLPPSSK